jgi:hypothetical protein
VIQNQLLRLTDEVITEPCLLREFYVWRQQNVASPSGCET